MGRFGSHSGRLLCCGALSMPNNFSPSFFSSLLEDPMLANTGKGSCTAKVFSCIKKETCTFYCLFTWFVFVLMSAFRYDGEWVQNVKTGK
jgi:hypothetical protein